MLSLARSIAPSSNSPAPLAAAALDPIPPLFLNCDASPFPIDALPPLLRDFSAAAELSLGLPAVAFALPMLALAGAAIGNSRRVLLNDDNYAPPLLWTALLARDDTAAPAAALRLVLAPFLERTAELAGEFELHRQHHIFLVNQWNATDPKERGPRPKYRAVDYPHLYLDDVAPATIPLRLAWQPRGLILAPRDLSSALASPNLFLLHYFDACPLRVDRPGVPPISRFLPHAFLAITGSLPARALQTILDNPNFDSPVPARFLFAPLPAYHARPGDVSIPAQLKSDWRKSITRLLSLPFESDPTPMPLTSSAKLLWLDAHDRLSALAVAQHHLPLRLHLTNLISYIPRVALILQLLSWSREQSVSDAIEDSAMTAAIRLIDWFFNQTPRLYAPPPDEDRQEILSIIELIKNHGNQITPRQLMRARARFRASANEAASFLRALAEQGFGEIVWLPSKGSGKPLFVFRLTSDSDNDPTGAPENGIIVTDPAPQLLPTQ